MPEKSGQRTQLAVVSPCSQCKNQRAVDADGKPACPRRALLKQAADAQAIGKPLSTAFDPALLTGTDSDALANPVYDAENHHILVWTANLADNMGFKDEASGLIVPKLLDDNFDTDYIQCHAKPYTAGMNEATYFLQGALSEWDTLEAVSVSTQYLDPTEPDAPDLLHVEGYVRRVDLAYRYPRRSLSKDLSARGT